MDGNIHLIEVVFWIDQRIPRVVQRSITKRSNTNLTDARKVWVGGLNVDRNEIHLRPQCCLTNEWDFPYPRAGDARTASKCQD